MNQSIFDILLSPVDGQPVNQELVSAGGHAHTFSEKGVLILDSEQKRLADQIYSSPQMQLWDSLLADRMPYYTTKTTIAGRIANAGYRSMKDFNHRKPGEWILDIGCGEAAQAAVLDDHTTYVGLDRNLERLENLTERYPDATAIYGDAGKLPFKDKSIKHVFSSFAFEHLFYLKDAALELHRCTTDDAVLSIVFPTEGGLWNLGRKLISKPRFTKKYPDLDFEFISHAEHCNQANQIIRTMETLFHVKRRYFPTGIPTVYCNIFVELICTKRDVALGPR